MTVPKAPDSTVAYLRSLGAVRDRSKQVYDLIVAGEADHWDWDESKLQEVVDFCAGLIKRDFGDDTDSIPPHCRKNHFFTPGLPHKPHVVTAREAGLPPIPVRRDRVGELLKDPKFPKDPEERAATLIDLYVVSVLLDAGAGNKWSYKEADSDWEGGRSEGLAVASWHMFKEGAFSDKPEEDPFRVDAAALQRLTPEILAKHMQVTDENPMSGLEGRTALLSKLGGALAARPDIVRNGRPGDLVYYFAPKLDANKTLDLDVFWRTLFELLGPIWPARTTLPGSDAVLGDVWPCPALDRALGSKDRTLGDSLVPFHKLTQWLSYSLIEPLEDQAGWTVKSSSGNEQTGLPEYRNGGLIVDFGLLKLRPDSLDASVWVNGKDAPPKLEPSSPAVVEWRAATVMALDRIGEGVQKKLGKSLKLAQVLEAATWKGGREIAKEKRPQGGGPPIEIVSDGTVF